MLRPLIVVPWAETALPGDIGDADVFVPSAPPYPNHVANQYSVGWLVNPAQVSKQPHQWINSWYQAIDWQLDDQRANNILWDAQRAYPKGALAAYDGKRWVAILANTNIVPGTSATNWVESKYGMLNATTASTQLVDMHNKVKAHIARKDNPHGVLWSDFAGAAKAYIDTQVGNAQTAANTHIGIIGQAHTLTVAQAGTLSALAGGIFTGQVSMLKMGLAGGSVIERVSNGFMIKNGHSAGLDSVKGATKDDEVFVTDNNFNTLKIRNNIKFSVPTPDIHLSLTSSLHVYTASGQGIDYITTATLAYTDKSGVAQTAPINEPAFGIDGLELRPSIGQALNVTGNATGTGTVAGILDGVFMVGDQILNKTNVLQYFPAGTAIKDIRIWFTPLTPEQKSALGA